MASLLWVQEVPCGRRWNICFYFMYDSHVGGTVAGTVLALCRGEIPVTIETLNHSATMTVALRLSASRWLH
ncbi:hypothetical protein XENOCAPTIV_018409, partial [Xenoophorus captivus]